VADSPKVVVIAGPNGAGKSTAASHILQDALAVKEFVNADVIARGLSAFKPESVALRAGKIMLSRLKELAAERADFAFGYLFHLVFVWLPGADFAIARVADRVRAGGHHVPDETVRRRYAAGLRNFFEMYMPLANSWQMVNNKEASNPAIIAEGSLGSPLRIFDNRLWTKIEEANRGI